MQYSHLRALFNTNKRSIALKHSTESFKVETPGNRTYIEPTIRKVIFEQEKPTIILVSAVGASGKTALARQLSIETELPILDLGCHRPVGGHSLTGLITESFELSDVSTILQGLQNGSYGIIIDAIDEGRSKTSMEAFESFLNNLTSLCYKSTSPVFLVLGRTAILDDCWIHVTDANVNAALVTIEPFSIATAQQYIDAFAKGASVVSRTN